MLLINLASLPRSSEAGLEAGSKAGKLAWLVLPAEVQP